MVVLSIVHYLLLLLRIELNIYGENTKKEQEITTHVKLYSECKFEFPVIKNVMLTCLCLGLTM